MSYAPNMRLLFRPLDQWPGEKDPRPGQSRFEAPWEMTVAQLDQEIGMIRRRDQWGLEVVIQLDAPERAFYADGRGVKADARVGYHGVVISFESKDGPLQFTCDRFNAASYKRSDQPVWHANVRAIALGLEHLRTIDRYGIAHSGQQYTGWRQLGAGIPMPAATMTVDEAARLLGDASDYAFTADEILQYGPRNAYRIAAKLHHPDNGGDPELFKRLTIARDLLLGAV